MIIKPFIKYLHKGDYSGSIYLPKFCLYFLSKVDLARLNKIFKWNPFKNESDWYDGFTCVNRNSSYHRWIQTMGFQTWSKLNCEYLFSASFLRACSIIRTNGVEYRREYDNETREINDASKYSSDFQFANNFCLSIPPP